MRKKVKEKQYFLRKIELFLIKFYLESLNMTDNVTGQAYTLGLCDSLCYPLLIVFGLIILRKLFRSGKRHETSNKVVVVTGCDSGFGRATVLAMIKEGYTVFAGCLNASNAEKDDSYQAIEKAAASRLHLMQMDVTKQDQIQQSLATVSEWLDQNKGFHLCAVVANAGIAHIFEDEMVSDEMFRQTMDVNFFGAVFTLKRYLPLLRKSNCQYKTLVIVSSLASQMPSPKFASYGASKSAIYQWANCLRFEVKRFGIRISTVCPDFYATDMVTSEAVLNRQLDHYKTVDPEILHLYGGHEKLEKKTKQIFKLLGKVACKDLSPVTDCISHAIATSSPKMAYFPVRFFYKVLLVLHRISPRITNKITQMLNK